MAAATTDWESEIKTIGHALGAQGANGAVGPRDPYGFPVAEIGNEGFLSTNVGSAYDGQRWVLQHELQQLNRNHAPKTEAVNEERTCMQAVDEALQFMQKQINKVPQPAWVNDTQKFNQAMTAFFNDAALEHGLPVSRVNYAVDSHQLRPTNKSEVAQKVQAVESQIKQMDGLVDSIDRRFAEIEKIAISPEDKKMLSRMLGVGNGVSYHSSLSIDAIYAVDPGRFEPKDGEGRPIKYDPANLIHVLQAVDHFLESPGVAMQQRMRLFGPNAIKELRDVLSGQSPISSHLENRSAWTNGLEPSRSDEDFNNPTSPNYRSPRFGLGPPGSV